MSKKNLSLVSFWVVVVGLLGFGNVFSHARSDGYHLHQGEAGHLYFTEQGRKAYRSEFLLSEAVVSMRNPHEQIAQREQTLDATLKTSQAKALGLSYKLMRVKGRATDEVATQSEVEVPKHKTAHEAHSAEQHAEGPQTVITKELEEVGIEEHVGDFLDGNIFFTNRAGVPVKFSTFLAQDKPILLSFFYATCPSLCQYVINAKSETLAKLGLELGNDFLAVSVSFDEKDTPELMETAYKKYMKLFRGFEKENFEQGAALPSSKATGAGLAQDLNIDKWTFLRGNRVAIQRLTTQLGFLFKRLDDPADEEFAHTAALYVITPNGKISRYFYGLLYPPFDVKMALVEAKAEKMRSTLDRILLYCYRYDSAAKGYVLYAQNIMKAGGVGIVLFLSIFIGLMLRFEKKRKEQEIADTLQH